MSSISMLGTGLIGDFYTMTLHGQRSRDRVRVVYSRSAERGDAFRRRWDIAESTTTTSVSGCSIAARMSVVDSAMSQRRRKASPRSALREYTTRTRSRLRWPCSVIV